MGLINLDTFKWVQPSGRTRTLKAWQLENSKQYKGLLHDTKNNDIKEVEFYDYWDLIDWISSFDFKFVARKEIPHTLEKNNQITLAFKNLFLMDNC